MTKKWWTFTFLTAFSIYWAVNLLLWFPWSISPVLGITLMLTVAPVIWSYGIIKCLQKCRSKKPIMCTAIIAGVYLLVAAIADYLFFGIYRNAMDDLYQPTTFYGYGFLVVLPFLLLLYFRKTSRLHQDITNKDLVSFVLPGLISIAALWVIIKFNISI